MLKQIIRRLIFGTLLSFLSSYAFSGWQTLATGVEYQDLANTLLSPWSHIHVFRIDLKHNQFDLVHAQSVLRKKQATVEDFAIAKDAQIAINGGFFDEKLQPLGLRISDAFKSNDLKKISWWGIFQIQNNRPSIIHYSEFHDEKIHFAIQSGPRLIIRGKIPNLKPGHAERTALGITTKEKIILLVTERAPLTTTELAKLMKRPPLSCRDALNLDGGSSSQIFAKWPGLKIKALGFSEVTDAILVKHLS
jgi:uncharacterized protein YigE (DUF2233 family)